MGKTTSKISDTADAAPNGAESTGNPARQRHIPIAVIGMSGRYPKARDLDALWSNLKAGVDGVGEADGSRWDLGFHSTAGTSTHRIYTTASGYIDNIDRFDADFFGMSPREARQVDPQHRLLLELTWEALESAGVVPSQIAGSKTGVFVGISGNDYATLSGQAVDAYTNIGSALSIAANRMSYVFDLHGPSMSIDTACSSSMVAMHQACRSITSGECTMALVGGVNMLISMRPYAGFAQASMLSPDGRCKSFDADGNGYVRAEGGGVLLLKPLADAERDGDQILAVVLATGANSDGKTMGMALPSGEAQESLLRQVYAECGVAPEDVFYVEAHGTGTAAGDPIETGAIGRVLGAPRTDGSVCHIGSIKSNIGHLEPGAGVAGLTKVLLAIKNREIPANLHFNTPNPKIDFEGGRIAVVDKALPLPEREKPLVFGVNSFGFGGTNAHAVLQEYRPARATAAAKAVPARPAVIPSENWGSLLPLSAQSTESLDTTIRAYADALRATPNDQWDAVRATAALMRTQHQHRIVVTASTPAEAADKLDRLAAGETVPGTARLRASGKGRLAFVFSGNGPQWWGMGRELLAESRIFRDEMTAIDAIFKVKAGWSLIEMMSRPRPEVKIELTEIAQPLLFAQQIAIVAVLKAAGITPDVVFGHSVGEAAAAYASGALTREQAVDVIFNRSNLQATTAGRGRMAALALTPDEAKAALAEIPGWLEIAAVNSPKAVTVAGDPEALEALCDRLTDEGKFARMLPLNYAFHTSAMDSIKDPLLERLASLKPGESQVPFISTVEGRVVAGPQLDADYWWRNIRAPVLFDAGVEAALKEHEIDVFLEIGPHPVLRDYVLQAAKAIEGSTAVAFGSLRRPSDKLAAPEVETLQTAIASVYAAGAGNPEAIHVRPQVPARLPAYPWNRVQHWRGAWELPDAVPAVRRDHPLLGHRTPSADGVWTNTIQAPLVGYLNDHVVQGAPLFPAAGYIELSFAAAGLQLGEAALELESFEILKPMVLAEGSEPIVQVSLDSADGTVIIRSRPDLEATNWTDHVKGRMTKVETGDIDLQVDLAAVRATMPVMISKEAHYAACDRRGLVYGPHFQGVSSIALTPADAVTRGALGEIDLPALDGKLDDYRSHPSLLDSCLQVLISLIGQSDPRDCATIPVQVAKIRSFAPLPSRIFCHVKLRHENVRTGVADMVITDADGRVLLMLDEARFQKVEFRASTLPVITEDWRPDPAWTPRRLTALALPEPAEIVARSASAVDAIIEATARKAYYAAVRPRMDQLVGAYAARAIRTLRGADKPFTLASLARDGGVPEDRQAMLAWAVGLAEADGLLRRDLLGQTPIFSWSADAANLDPEALRRALMLDHSGYGAELVAIARAGEQLAARLAGEPDGQSGVAMRESLDDTAPYRMPYNRMAAEAVRTMVAAWPAGRPIRVVEMNGGTGGLTASVLPVLPPERSDYLFADPSEQATTRASNRFSDYHFLRDAAIESGNLIETGFDLALAGSDVAAADLYRSLCPGGVALVLHANPDRVSRLLFPDQADASADAILTCLSQAGFEAGTLLADAPAAEGAMTSQALIIARRPAAPAEPVRAREPVEAAGRRVLVVSAAEAATPFVAALRDAMTTLGQTLAVHVLDDADVTDEAMTALVAREADAVEFIHMAGWAAATAAGPDLLAGQDMRCLSAILLARAIELKPVDEAGATTASVLTVVTRGAFASPGGTAPLDPFQATIAGTARVMANEQVAIDCRLIDVHATAEDVEAAGVLADALLARDDETEVLLLDGRRYVHRMRESSIAEQTRITGSLVADREPAEARPFRLDFLPQGGLDSLHLREIERRAPGEGEVEIKIHAAGLNFRDVLWTMGMLPEDAVEKGFSGPTIGMECAGEVVRVGAGVTSLKLGDRVVAFASSCFASHVTTNAESAGRFPDTISYEAAATIPTAFITAWYALDHLARLEPGETVLIHGAAGGVGLAALQIAKLKGAVVFATAGAADKQKLVRTMGADHVLSSRSLKFADDVMRLTNGKGVDIVLNSLAGEAITKGLQVLKPFGRFLEIGKRDLYANSRIGLRPFRQNLSYFGIDADTLLVERPELAKRVFDAVLAAMVRGDLRPLPYQLTPVSRAAEAFRAMQKASHVGKLVIGLDAEPHAGLPIVASGKGVIRPDATYLVTGGLSGFGLATAEWLVQQGARSLALLGRRGDTTEEAQAGLARIRAAGAEARAFALDVADRPGLERVLMEVRSTMKPLKGVIHSAALIEDAPLIKVDRELMHRVMSAKMIGAWNLHEATLTDGLETFVLYSSSSVVVGNPGQGTYVAANAFLNALAELRRAKGLPALAVGWGAIKDAGFLTRNAAVEEMLEQRAGMEATPVRVAMGELGRLMASGACKVAAAQFNLMRLGQSLPGARTPRFSNLMPEGAALMLQGAGSMAEALAAMDEDERRSTILSCVTEHVSRVVGSPASQIEPGRALSELGLDSLMAVELAEALEQSVGKPVSVMQMIQAGTVSGVVDVVMRGFANAKPAPGQPEAPAAAPAKVAA